MKMPTSLFGLIILCANSALFAENMPILNTVQMQLSAAQWVTSATAVVTIGVDETLINTNMASAQAALMKKLAKIANATWHVVSVNVGETESGLQKMNVVVQARLADADISGLRERVKSMNQSGQKFTIASVNFAPSLDEMTKASVALREQIYQQVKAELTRLHAVYPQQHYFVHQITFNSQPVRAGLVLNGVNTFIRQGDGGMAVGRRVMQSATVVLSSKVNP